MSETMNAPPRPKKEQPPEPPVKQVAVANDFLSIKPRIKKVWSEYFQKDVCLREMSAAARDRYGSGMLKQTKDAAGKMAMEADMSNQTAKLLVLCLCDEGGNLLFEEAHAAILGNVPAKALDELRKAAEELSGLGEEAVEGAVKNSVRTDTGGSS
jgi:hypothetical protein